MEQYKDMRLVLLFLFFVFTLSCANVASNPTHNEIQSPTPESAVVSLKPDELRPVTENLELNQEQVERLNTVLPVKVREILENSQIFSILGENADGESDLEGMDFKPNRIVRITDEKVKNNLLDGLYHDLANDPVPAACFTPHHAIRAEHQGQAVEIDICFSCSNIIVRSPYVRFSGGMTYTNRISEELITRLLREKGVALTK